MEKLVHGFFTEDGVLCYRPHPYMMFSGQGEAQERGRKYHLVTGRKGKKWLYSATDVNPAEYIYVQGAPGSNGFGGAELTFSLIEGGEIKLKGPWHCNTEALLEDTGVDLRDKFITFGVIGKSRAFDNGMSHMGYVKDVIYYDRFPVLGEFERLKPLSEKMSEELQMPLYFYSMSRGGSRLSPVNFGKKW